MIRNPKCDYTEARKADPHSVAEPLNSEEHEDWNKAMLKECENLIRNQTWDFILREKGHCTMRNKWDFKRKYDENGVLARQKARIIALGNTQHPGIDYDRTYASVVKTKSTHLLMAMAADKGWDIHLIDIVAAYLIADIDREIVMEVPSNLTELSDKLRETFPDMPSKEDLMSG